MSGAVIDLLNASAETTGIPPCVPFAHDSTDTGAGLVAAEGDFTPTDSLKICVTEIECTQTEVAEPEAIGGEAAEDLMPVVDETISAETQAPSSNPDLWLYRDRT